jgi:hypothetical protein
MDHMPRTVAMAMASVATTAMLTSASLLAEATV